MVIRVGKMVPTCNERKGKLKICVDQLFLQTSPYHNAPFEMPEDSRFIRLQFKGVF